MSEDLRVQSERARNLWERAVSKLPPLARATQFVATPEVGSDRIGGLDVAQEEVLTYACAMTNREVYAGWGTYPPAGMLLLGPPGGGKQLLATALATRANTSFLRIGVPKLALEIMHQGGKVGELLAAWDEVLGEMPPVTLFFQELEFSQAQELGARRPDLPIGPIMDFLLEFLDRAIAIEHSLVVGSTSHPDTLRPAFVLPGRFERVVEVSPRYPEDVVAALEIHARDAEKRAGRPLFDPVDWTAVVRQFRDPSVGDWIRLMHGVLRRKARCEAAHEEPGPVTTQDLLDEVDRYRKASNQLPSSRTGTYV